MTQEALIKFKNVLLYPSSIISTGCYHKYYGEQYLFFEYNSNNNSIVLFPSIFYIFTRDIFLEIPKLIKRYIKEEFNFEVRVLYGAG